MLALWVSVFVRTITMLQNGAIFESPGVEDIDAIARGFREQGDEVEKDEGHEEEVRVAIYANGKSNGSDRSD